MGDVGGQEESGGSSHMHLAAIRGTSAKELFNFAVGPSVSVMILKLALLPWVGGCLHVRRNRLCEGTQLFCEADLVGTATAVSGLYARRTVCVYLLPPMVASRFCEL